VTGRARARDLDLAPGMLPTGPVNAITDVAGVRVGHATLIEGDGIRTGVTAIVHDALLTGTVDSKGSLPAGLAVYNGYGKMVGSTQLRELGVIETPVLLTSTLSVFRVADALLSYLRRLPGNRYAGTLNPVVAETNDGYLSDGWARAITDHDVWAAVYSAVSGPVPEGCVGAGTGTGALGYKAGIGTSSRLVSLAGGAVTVGALVQSNFGGTLTVRGVPVPPPPPADAAPPDRPQGPEPTGGSCVIVLVTDGRLDARQLERVAWRAFAGMARAGSDFSGRSGDYALAISTASEQGPGVGAGPFPINDLDLIFTAAIEATEEAILNSLLMAVTTAGFGGHVRHAVPLDYIRALVSAT
jgi:D-aminopeptidase